VRHRKFLLDYFTGDFENSIAKGLPFGRNLKTSDARISGSLASMVGLEVAIQKDDKKLIDDAIQVVLLLHSLIMSFGGIPLLYYGDEIGTLNDDSFLLEESKANDNRWIHRPRIDWLKAELRNQHGSIEQQIFSGIQKLIAVRKRVPAFADYNNRELLELGNDSLFAFVRYNPERHAEQVLVVANFDSKPQHLNLTDLRNRGQFQYAQLRDYVSGDSPAIFKEALVIPPYRYYWLSDQHA
ncbi:MAG: alpha-glucosidase C-terminal domain-containing protein, partial [Pseudomonadales bacterium]